MGLRWRGSEIFETDHLVELVSREIRMITGTTDWKVLVARWFYNAARRPGRADGRPCELGSSPSVHLSLAIDDFRYSWIRNWPGSWRFRATLRRRLAEGNPRTT